MKYPDTELQDATVHSAEEIVRMAGEDFDAWCRHHAAEVGDLDIVEQAAVYAQDSAWHSR